MTASEAGSRSGTDTGIEAVRTEIARLTAEGWLVASAEPQRVVLEQRRGLPFCVNVLLTLATAFFWLLYWVPAMRRPRAVTKILTLTPEGRMRVTTTDDRVDSARRV